MINFFEVVTQAFAKTCKEKYEITLIDNKIIKVIFEKFAIILYYSKYEFELGVNYCINGKEYSLDHVLLNLKCDSKLIPSFKFMTDDEIMEKYLCEYIELINHFYNQLCKCQF